MGTTCEIIRVNPDDDTVDMIHISYDGYLSGVGLTLFMHYNTPEAVAALFGHETGATSLEADPLDMDWCEWHESPKGLAEFIADARRSAIYYNTPDNPEAGARLVEAMAATGIVSAAPGYLRSRSTASLPIGSINENVDVRQLPPALVEQLPAIVEATFGRALPASYFSYGSIASIANHATVPNEFTGEDEDKNAALGKFVWAHGRWAYPRNVTDMATFIETGESPRVITRELLLEAGCREEQFSATPSRPVNEMIGTLKGEDGIVVLATDGGIRWSIAASSIDLPEEAFDKRVVVRHGAMMVSRSTNGDSTNVIQITQLAIVQ